VVYFSKLKPQKKQGGVALLVILLVVAIISILATEMISRLQLNIARTINIKDNNQAYWYAIGAEQFAQKSLGELKTLSGDNINLSQPWAQVFEYPLDSGGIQAELIDLQACFNLNTVGPIVESEEERGDPEPPKPLEPEPNNPTAAPKTPAEAFHNLITISSDSIDSFTADTLRDSLIDWLDADDDVNSYGAEDAEYESLEIPYVAANALMGNKSELRLINGVELRFLRDLLPHVCVIPDVGYNTMEVNVNTIIEENAAVLAALLNIDIADAQNIITSRPEDGYSDLNQFFSEPVISNQNLTEEQKAWFKLDTNYFMLRTKTRYNEASFKMTSIFKLDDGSSSRGVSVISREFGGVN
jgi:general secretion pathway protein K